MISFGIVTENLGIRVEKKGFKRYNSNSHYAERSRNKKHVSFTTP